MKNRKHESANERALTETSTKDYLETGNKVEELIKASINIDEFQNKTQKVWMKFHLQPLIFQR